MRSMGSGTSFSPQTSYDHLCVYLSTYRTNVVFIERLKVGLKSGLSISDIPKLSTHAHF